MSPHRDVGRPRLILASGSPRRRDLLASVGVEPAILATDIDETPIEGEGAAALVSRLAQGKAMAAASAISAASVSGADLDPADSPDPADSLGPGDPILVIGSDTVVELDDVILGKPVDDQDAKKMLQALSGRIHRAITGVCIVSCTVGSAGAGDRQVFEDVSATRVAMRQLSAEDIDWYLASRDHMGKAGSYAIQGFAAPFVVGVEGAYDGVVGLPLNLVDRLLSVAGWPLREFSNIHV